MGLTNHKQCVYTITYNMKRFQQILTALRSLYAPEYLGGLVRQLELADYRVGRYLARYWSTQDFTTLEATSPHRVMRNRVLWVLVFVGSLIQALLGLAMIVYALSLDVSRDDSGALPFGLALIISYPIVWAHMLGFFYGGYKVLWTLTHPKVAGRALLCELLENQVVRLRQKHKFTVIAVAGGIGKTSTKLAIAHSLEPTRRVIYQTGNYNDRVTVPLVLFGQSLPNLFNIVAWTKILLANEQAISRPNFYDIAVLEIGTDHPGDIKQFAYLQPDITVVTAIVPEHMEYFGTLDAVAAEELTVCDFSKQVLIGADNTPAKYLKGREVLTFGTSKDNDFRASGYNPQGLEATKLKLHLQHDIALDAQVAIVGQQGVKIVLAAAAAAQLAGLSPTEVSHGLKQIKPFAGRMQVLPGIHGSTIIDDTYNASPVAVKAALDVLYGVTAPQRIAILGNMNELGDYSQEAHTEVGKYCRADKLDLVATIGPNAAKYLAPAALGAGCKVESFDSPYSAGAYVRARLKKSAVILAEGSQNGVFAEESLKVLLAHKADTKKLVRQTASWMRIKRSQFPPAG